MQSGVYNVTVVAEQTSAEVFIPIFDDSIVEVNETFTAVLSVPVAESALGVSVRTTNGTAYAEIQDNGKQSVYTCMSLSVDSSSPIVSSPDEAYITFSKMSYQVTEGSGYVLITLLVVGQVSVEYTFVIANTNGTATGEISGTYLTQQ